MRPRWQRNGAGVVGYALGLGLVGALSASFYRDACLDPGPPVARPESGSPRGHLCAAVHPDWPFFLAAATVLLVGALAYRLGPERRVTTWSASLLGLGQIALAVWVSSLQFASTI